MGRFQCPLPLSLLLLGWLWCGARALQIPVDARSGNNSLCVSAQDLVNVSAAEYPTGEGQPYTTECVYRSLCSIHTNLCT